MLKEKARAMLEGKLIPFWSGLRDDEYGGYYGLLDFDLNLDKKAEKGCILNSRILWFFSRCAKDLNRADCRVEADHAYAFLRDHCLDRPYGGVYWSLHYDGTPLDTTKHTYNQAFAIYALSAYYDLTGNREALDTAFRLFETIERRCRDEDGYLEAFDRTFHPESNEKLSENGVMAERTMNTLLHVFEGYSGLYQVTEDPKVKNALLEILWIYKNKIYNSALRRQEVFFDREYSPLIDLHSYVVYVFVTDLKQPAKVIAEPAGFLIAPRDWERVGDVSNVVFTNGAIAMPDGNVYIYYAASDTRLHVASTTVDRLLDYAFHTPADPLRSRDCVAQRVALIEKNLELLG